MQYISQVHVLVHPDFEALSPGFMEDSLKTGELALHPLQVALRDQWEKRVSEIEANPSSMLIYITALPGYSAEHIESPTNFREEVLNAEQKRISEWEERLGNRFILIPNSETESRHPFKDVLLNRGLRVDPEGAELFAFGEYYDHCVDEMGEIFKSLLDVADARYNKDERLSLSTDSVFMVRGFSNKEH